MSGCPLKVWKLEFSIHNVLKQLAELSQTFMHHLFSILRRVDGSR